MRRTTNLTVDYNHIQYILDNNKIKKENLLEYNIQDYNMLFEMLTTLSIKQADIYIKQFINWAIINGVINIPHCGIFLLFKPIKIRFGDIFVSACEYKQLKLIKDLIEIHTALRYINFEKKYPGEIFYPKPNSIGIKNSPVAVHYFCTGFEYILKYKYTELYDYFINKAYIYKYLYVLNRVISDEISKNRLDNVKYLISKGADLSTSLVNPIGYSISNLNIEMIKYLHYNTNKVEIYDSWELVPFRTVDENKLLEIHIFFGNMYFQKSKYYTSENIKAGLERAGKHNYIKIFKNLSIFTDFLEKKDIYSDEIKIYIDIFNMYPTKVKIYMKNIFYHKNIGYYLLVILFTEGYFKIGNDKSVNKFFILCSQLHTDIQMIIYSFICDNINSIITNRDLHNYYYYNGLALLNNEYI